MFGMNLKQLVHKKKTELFQSLELWQQGIDLSQQKMTSDKTEEIRFKSDRCPQPDKIPQKYHLMRSKQLSLAHYMIHS